VARHVPETSLHEAWHAVSVRHFEDEARIVHVELDPADDATLLGRCRVERPDVPTAGRLLTALLGPLGESRPPKDWPPPTYEDALQAKREGLGAKIKQAGLTAAGYYRLARLALEISADPALRLEAFLIAHAVERERFLTGDAVERILSL
jgi:hypothetical protein